MTMPRPFCRAVDGCWQARVWLPPSFDPVRKYPVLYILDGASAFDVCTSFDHTEMHADETLTELITTGKIPPLIAVGIDNGSNAIWDGDGGLERNREFLPYPDRRDNFSNPLSDVKPVYCRVATISTAA
jgi:enterochelin esterase-like enzyme